MKKVSALKNLIYIQTEKYAVTASSSFYGWLWLLADTV